MLAALLALLGGYLWYVGAVGFAQLAHAASLVLLGAGLALPVALMPIYFLYMWLARIVAFVNIHLPLRLVFYTLFTLIGLSMRLLGRDPARPQKSLPMRKVTGSAGPSSLFLPRTLSQALLKCH